MYLKKEPYTYFQPGEIVFFITHASDEPINRNARDPETKRRVFVESTVSEGEQPFDLDDVHDDPDDDEDHKNTYDQQIQALLDWSQGIADSLGLNVEILRAEGREIHFRGTRQEQNSDADADSQPGNKRSPAPRRRDAFSLIPADVRLPKKDRDSSNDREVFVKNPDLARLVVALDNQRNEQPLNQEITLRAVSPNWLCSPGSEWGGGGGPGGVPEPYNGCSSTMHFIKPPPDNAAFSGVVDQEGSGVTVAILDTAPCLKDLAKAYERYHKVDPQKREKCNGEEKRHDLIESLLKPDGHLVVHPASLDELYRMRAVHLRDHDYEMTDHGLFVAGIIHTLAPGAKIHLYEVLNHQGVGDLTSIAQGFWKVFNRFSRRKLVVNASLTLRIPRPGHSIENFDPAFMKKIIQDWENPPKSLTSNLLTEEGDEWLKRQGEAIEWICDNLYVLGSRVIAAAGNDWRKYENQPRPEPGFPAAFEPVLGVGAEPKNAQPDTNGLYPVSSYSNTADEPEVVGVTTFGGEPGEGNGVLGVYIGEFPDMCYRLKQYPWILWPFLWLYFTIKWRNCFRPRNKSDWAWWCGTSFATPIVAGFAAAALSDSTRPASTRAAIDLMYTTQGIMESRSVDREDRLAGVTQN